MRLSLLLLLLLPAFSTQADNLTLYVYPPSSALNWSSPHKLLRSFLGTEISKNDNDWVGYEDENGLRRTFTSNYISTMGHTIGHIQCVLPSGQRYERWVSFSGQNYTEVDKDLALNKKIGLGLLKHSYIDGHMIVGEENLKRLIHYTNDAGAEPRYLQVPVSAAKCKELADMTEFFIGFNQRFLQPNGQPYPEKTPYSVLAEIEKQSPWNNLRFNTDDPYTAYLKRKTNPRHIVGGGCAPFGAALLKMAGYYDEKYLDHFWKRPVVFSTKLVGVPGVSEVSAISLLLGLEGNHWTYEGYPNEKLNMYDPHLIWNFIGSVQQCLQGAACNSDISSWMNQRGYHVTLGAKHLYEGSYVQVIRRKRHSDGKGFTPEKRIQRSKKIEVPGIVLR